MSTQKNRLSIASIKAGLFALLVLMLATNGFVGIATAGNPPSPSEYESLRNEGPETFDRLYGEYRAFLEHSRVAQTGLTELNTALNGWEQALDAIGAARFSSRSGLYWYTDWEQAVEVAQRENKPILSLRLLGQLTEDASCANSRYFRTLLYPDPRVSSLLKEQYVLHWKSVRPVPKVTIDFGDGRTICTTLTGNSIHYITTPQGVIVDAMPGLNGPGWFQAWLTETSQVAKAIDDIKDSQLQAQVLEHYHSTKMNQVLAEWNQKLDSIEGASRQGNEEAANDRPDATKASRVAPTKSVVVEAPLLANLYKDLDRLSDRTDNGEWEQISNFFIDHCQLSPEARQIIHEQTHPNLTEDTGESMEQLIEQRIKKLQSTLAWDTAFNVYQLHGKVRQLILDGGVGAKVDDVNESVYETVFLTPRHDRWLGLLPVDRYTALENDGIESGLQE